MDLVGRAGQRVIINMRHHFGFLTADVNVTIVGQSMAFRIVLLESAARGKRTAKQEARQLAGRRERQAAGRTGKQNGKD